MRDYLGIIHYFHVEYNADSAFQNFFCMIKTYLLNLVSAPVS